MTRYRLCSHVEEFHCPECGEPVYVGEHAIELDGDRHCSPHCTEAATAAVFAPAAIAPESGHQVPRIGYQLETSRAVLSVRTSNREPAEMPNAEPPNDEPIRWPVRYNRAVLAVSCPDCGAKKRSKCQDRSRYLARARRHPCPARVEHSAGIEGMKRRGVWSPMIPPSVQLTLFDCSTTEAEPRPSMILRCSRGPETFLSRGAKEAIDFANLAFKSTSEGWERLNRNESLTRANRQGVSAR